MVTDKKVIKNAVKQILVSDSATRNSDKLLYLKTCEHFAPGCSGWTFEKAMLGDSLPTMESVRRSRQKLQELYPELGPDNQTAAMRKLEEDAYMELVKSLL